MAPLILRVDTAGTPVRWIPWQDAVTLYCKGLVAWTAGDNEFTFYGGVCRITGQRSSQTVHSIIAIKRSQFAKPMHRIVPPLNNHELFRRDGHMCLYCGKAHQDRSLTRDHVMPLSLGGSDCWSNVVSCCRDCNTRKGGRTPEHAGMPLLAIPYVPNWAEFLALSNRRILADQMGFLKTQFNRNARLSHLQ